MAFGQTISKVEDVLAVTAQMLESAETEITYVVAPAGLGFTAQYSFLREGAKNLVQTGGHVRGVTNISYHSVSTPRKPLLDIGEELRHCAEVQKVLILVCDRKESISSTNVARQEFLLDDPLVAFWTDDSTYAKYRHSSFELTLTHSIPVTERLKESAEEGPVQT